MELPNDEYLRALDLVSVAMPPPDITQENTSAYLAGYLLRKVDVQCAACRTQLVLKVPPKDHQTYIFLVQKAYKEEGTLFYPTEIMVQFVEKLELLFTNSFRILLHSHGILNKMCTNATYLCKGWLLCNEELCMKKVVGMARLYLRLRIHFACKLSNTEDKNCGKRNRKYLKLSYV